jgi:hypothetical protein
MAAQIVPFEPDRARRQVHPSDGDALKVQRGNTGRRDLLHDPRARAPRKCPARRWPPLATQYKASAETEPETRVKKSSWPRWAQSMIVAISA